MKQLSIASISALSLSVGQAARLNTQFKSPATPISDSKLAQNSGQPMSYSNIMQSVKNLEKAYEFHKNEEKLLNDINTELGEYWHVADMSHKYVQDDHSSLLQAKVQQKVDAKAEVAKPAAPVPPAPEVNAQTSASESKPVVDNSNADSENIQLEDSNFVQLDLDDAGEFDVVNTQTADKYSDLFNKELEQLRLRHKNKNHHKSKINVKAIHKARQNQKMKAAQEAKVLAQSKAAESVWHQEMNAASQLEQAKMKMQMKNEALAREQERENAKARETIQQQQRSQEKMAAQNAAHESQLQAQRQQAQENEQELADAEMDLKLKIQAAEEAAANAERLAQEAQSMALQIETNQESKQTSKQSSKKEEPAYKFVQIPRYAFTTDLEEDNQINMDNEEDFDLDAALKKGKSLFNKAKGLFNVQEENDIENEEDLENEEDFDLDAALKKGKSLFNKAKGLFD